MEKDDDVLRETDTNNKKKIKDYAEAKANIRKNRMNIGDHVLIKKTRSSKSDPYYDPRPYQITEIKGNMVTAARDYHTITRNVSFFKQIADVDGENYEEDEWDYIESTAENGEMNINDETEDIEPPIELPEDADSLPRRSTRVTGQPVRYPLDVRM